MLAMVATAASRSSEMHTFLTDHQTVEMVAPEEVSGYRQRPGIQAFTNWHGDVSSRLNEVHLEKEAAREARKGKISAYKCLSEQW